MQNVVVDIDYVVQFVKDVYLGLVNLTLWGIPLWADLIVLILVLWLVGAVFAIFHVKG